MNQEFFSYVSTIAEIRRDTKFEGYVLVRSADNKTSSNGKTYLDMNLSDRSGVINAKMWDGNIPVPAVGSIVKIRATGNEYNGRMQLRVEKLDRTTKNDPVDMSMLVPCAPENPEQMKDEVFRAADQIQDRDYRLIAVKLLEKAGNRLLTFPAAKQMHHAERSGLLYHTVKMLRAARALLPVYPELNPSLLTAGIIIHDLGKLDEMQADEYGFVSDYTTDGKLIGHLVRGIVLIESAAKEVNADSQKTLLLQHMILAHHGIIEYGSPKPPMFPEAEVLHLLDTLDARLDEMFDALKHTPPGSFTEKIWGLENRQLYRIPDANQK